MSTESKGQVSPDDDEFNRCVYNTLEYDGPSEFNLADTKNLDFVVGSGNYDANIYVYTAADANEPTIEIRGAVSPYYDDNDPMTSLASRKKIIPKRGSRTGGRGEMNTVYQGLHFETNRTGDHTTFFVWYEDHILQDEWGMPYSTCALLQMDLVLPPAVDLQRLSIHGNQVKIHTRDLKGIRFDTVSLSSKRGEIHVMDLIRADTVVAKVEEKGDVTLESVEVATTGAVLEIAATAKKGDVLVNALISPADLSREMDQKDSKIVAISQTGTVQVNVHAKPSERSLVEDQSIRSSLGSLWVVAQSESGQVQTQISLLGKDQNLRLQGESKTGKVTSIISDEFSGRFNIEAPLGIAMIETATKPGSSSQIIYEKELVTTKAGTKSGQDGKEIHGGQVELRSRFGGSVFLGFV
ncbi:hypothetical protein BGW38_005010 [Lunasporangiospora selenospora]|uniref:Uncharacterized protein n=1 Tax=Lunasporangiospora selenospora TaxID=979761 RepID=A0A9P6FQJ0_9FUNG|nr:hypothetical protein BGW38_005010 [Lunasporangiospora selenospora]